MMNTLLRPVCHQILILKKINANIQTLTYDLKRVPLTTYFYNLVKRMELEKAKREGRTFKIYW